MCSSSCGNEIVESPETCDHGTNQNGYDGVCSKECQLLTQTCGNNQRE